MAFSFFVCLRIIHLFFTQGSFVRSGEIIGTIATVLSKDKGRPMAMLHFELYEVGYRGEKGRPYSLWEPPERSQPPGLLDPTNLLMSIFRRYQGLPIPASTAVALGRDQIVENSTGESLSSTDRQADATLSYGQCDNSNGQ